MAQQDLLKLTALIINKINAAWENGYYTDTELNSNGINFVEIREWCGLNTPDLDGYTAVDFQVDDLIEQVYNQIKSIYKTVK